MVVNLSLSLCTIPEDLSVSETGLHLRNIVSRVSWLHNCRSVIIISTEGQNLLVFVAVKPTALQTGCCASK